MKLVIPNPVRIRKSSGINRWAKIAMCLQGMSMGALEVRLFWEGYNASRREYTNGYEALGESGKAMSRSC
jgi:hypothetical protein